MSDDPEHRRSSTFDALAEFARRALLAVRSHRRGPAGPVTSRVPFTLPVDGAPKARTATSRAWKNCARCTRQPEQVPTRGIVIYCTIGNRASQVWFRARVPARGTENVDVYYGSWAEWGSRGPTPR